MNKEQLRRTPSKLMHKRGISSGVHDIPESQTFNMLLNPKLSMY